MTGQLLLTPAVAMHSIQGAEKCLRRFHNSLMINEFFVRRNMQTIKRTCGRREPCSVVANTADSVGGEWRRVAPLLDTMGRNRSLASSPAPARRRIVRLLSSLALPALVCLGAAGMLAGCGGGDGYNPPQPTGLLFAYPDLGQKNVPLGSQIVLAFPGTVSQTAARQAIALKGPGDQSAKITIPHDGVVKFTHTSLLPHTQYSVVIKPGQTLQAGDTTFKGGDDGLVLTHFTTTYKHNDQVPDGFNIVSINPSKKYPIAEFNTLPIQISAPYSPPSVLHTCYLSL